MKGKSVVVTGAGGFIGSHLVEKLIFGGAKVTAFVHYNALGGIGNLQFIKNIRTNKNCRIVFGDITDSYSCLNLLKKQDIVFHLAALIDIPYSYRAPKSYFEVNTLGTINLLDAAVRNNVRRFIQVSTSEVYGNSSYEPMDENHPLCARSPYAASKIGADQAVLSYAASFNLPFTIARPFNTYGPRQSTRAVIPNIISQALFSKKNIEVGTLTASRDFTYVTDTVDAFIRIAKSPKTINQVINIGSSKKFSIKELYTLISKSSNKNKHLSLNPRTSRPENSDIQSQICDNKKIRKLLFWEPKISINEGLANTIEWIKEHEEFYNI